MYVDTVVIGGGQAGLATSWHLTRLGVEHVILEHGRPGERWRTERWDSLRLLTPNWQTSLPGCPYEGNDSQGFMPARGMGGLLERYAGGFGAPVQGGTAVRSLERRGGRFVMATDGPTWRADQVVVATGQFARPRIPTMARRLPGDVMQLSPATYRRPAQLPDGAVLVVGASASGLQIAEELRHAGRRVVLAVGRHTRLPRRYRGRDILEWLHLAGVLDEQPDGASPARRPTPSMQLVGRRHGRFDLGAAQSLGIELAGRLVAVDGRHLRFADDLADTLLEADRRMRSTLTHVDRYVDRAFRPGHVPAATPIAPIVGHRTPAAIDVVSDRIAAVVWATGFRADHRWVRLPALDCEGQLHQRGGVTPVAGLYTVGMRFQTSRRSTFIDGVGRDAALVAHNVARRDPAAADELISAANMTPTSA